MEEAETIEDRDDRSATTTAKSSESSSSIEAAFVVVPMPRRDLGGSGELFGPL